MSCISMEDFLEFFEPHCEVYTALQGKLNEKATLGDAPSVVSTVQIIEL
jgi:hypothetical protein